MAPNTVHHGFALEDGGRLIALVADGPAAPPEWPAELASVEDPQLRELEQAYLAEFERLAAETPDTDEARAANEARLEELAGYVRDLRGEAATRMSEQGGEPGDGDQGGEPAAPGAPGEGDQGTGDDGAGGGDQGGGEPAASRDSRIAAMRAAMDQTPPQPPPDPGVSREDLVAAVGAMAERIAAGAATAAVQAVLATVPAGPPATAARGGAATAADLGAYADGRVTPDGGGVAVRPRIDARLLSTADIPNVPMGQEFTEIGELVEAFRNRADALGSSSTVGGEKVPIATLRVDVPEERDIRGVSDFAGVRDKVRALLEARPLRIDPDAVGRSLVASGGLDAPVEPYYGQLVVASAARPFRDSMVTMVAERGGIKLVLPPSIGSITGIATTGQFADGVTNTDTSLVSATAAFTGADVGSYVTGAAFTNGTRIATVTNATTVVLDRATLSTGTARTFALSGRNPNNLGAPVGLVTAAQDAAGPPNTVKYTYDVPLGTQAEFDVYSVYTSLQFANLTARTSPERVEAYIRVADALHARVAETQMMDVVTAWSTLFTGAKTFGSARQLMAQWGHMGAFYRNSERMEADAPLRIGIPAWSIQNMRADYLSSFIGGGAANWGLSDDEIIGFFVDNHLSPFFYLDGPSDVSQLFSTTGLSGATNTGTNTATPIAIPEFPGSGATTSFRTKVVSFMWAEGTWLGLTTGELNLGLVRDSILNSQNRFRNFVEEWETPAFVGTRSLRSVHTVAADGTYGAAASITLGAGSGL